MEQTIRGLDGFGIPIRLRLKGDSEYKTACGGLISILMRALVTFYFCIKLLSVVNYDDAQIISYKVLDNRRDMTEPIKLPDYNMEVFFFFTDTNATPKRPDPSIGSFKLSTNKGIYDGGTGLRAEATNVSVQEVDFIKENNTIAMYDGSPIKGIYKA